MTFLIFSRAGCPLYDTPAWLSRNVSNWKEAATSAKQEGRFENKDIQEALTQEEAILGHQVYGLSTPYWLNLSVHLLHIIGELREQELGWRTMVQGTETSPGCYTTNTLLGRRGGGKDSRMRNERPPTAHSIFVDKTLSQIPQSPIHTSNCQLVLPIYDYTFPHSIPNILSLLFFTRRLLCGPWSCRGKAAKEDKLKGADREGRGKDSRGWFENKSSASCNSYFYFSYPSPESYISIC